MAERLTQYCNTDLDLKSTMPLDALAQELEPECDVLRCDAGSDSNWHMLVESNHGEITANRNAALDINAMLDVIAKISPKARKQYDQCFLREFNIGFECWDTWGYNQKLQLNVLQSVVRANCTLSVTLYPMRNPDGTPKDDEDGGITNG